MRNLESMVIVEWLSPFLFVCTNTVSGIEELFRAI